MHSEKALMICSAQLGRMRDDPFKAEDRLASCRIIHRLADQVDDLTHFQNQIAEQGGPAILVNLLKDCLPKVAEDECDMCAIEAFWVLGMLCFSNPHVSHQVGRHPEFFQLVNAVLASPQTSSTLKKQAVYPCQNVASYSFESHEKMWFLIPQLTSLLADTAEEKFVRSEIVILINNFAYNSDSHPALLQAGVIEPLVSIMNTGDMSLVYPLAAIAIANIQDCKNSSPAHKELIHHISAFFDAALRGVDYPENSGMFPVPWKIAMATSRLSSNPANVELMNNEGVVNLLEKALTTANSDPRLNQYALTALWNLSSAYY